MSKVIDARGMACPRPVMMARKALDSIAGGQVTVLVDNAGARENLVLLAGTVGCAVTVGEIDGGFGVTLTKGLVEGSAACDSACSVPASSGGDRGPLVVVISTDRLGQGDEELGRMLMKSFIFTLGEGQRPDTLIFLNAGVHFATEGTQVLETLQKLSAAGTEILSCGTCLNFYQLQERLVAGQVTNMYAILEKLAAAGRSIIW